MGRWLALLWLALAACLLSFAGGAVAQAKPGYTVNPPFRYRSFELRGTNGFYVLVTADGDGTLEVELRRVRPNSHVDYSVHARFAGNLIRARFGNRGRISMRFEPSGPFKPSREPQGDCRGREGLVQQGTFVGRFAIRGEGGFTEAKATRVPGISVRAFRQVCKGKDAGPEPAVVAPETTLSAFRRLPARTVGLRAAVRAERFARVEEFEGYVVESRAGLLIERVVHPPGAPGEFTFDEAAGSAAVAPPPPFAGTAALRPGEGSKPTWTGDLMATFPGLGKIPLAGPGFRASLTERAGGVGPQG
jgi:hypothetical protein